MSRQRRKGTAAESAVVDYLHAHGFPASERRALAGAKDRGDIAGIPGVVIEVKSAARLDIPAWLRETKAEQANDRARIGLLVIKPRGIGTTRVGDWWAVLPLADAIELIRTTDERGTQ